MANKTNWQDVQIYQCAATDGASTAASVSTLMASGDHGATMYATKGLAVALRQFRDHGAAQRWCFVNSADAGTNVQASDVDWSGLDEFLAAHKIDSNAAPEPGLSGFMGRESS